MGGTGVRIGSKGSDDSGADLSALGDMPASPPSLPQMDGSLPPPATAASWLRDWQSPGAQPTSSLSERFGNLLGVEGMADQPPSPVSPPMPAMDRYRQNDEGMQARQSRIDAMAKAQLPQTKAPKGSMVEGQMGTSSRPGTNPKTALPLYFAKAMGYAVPGESGDEEEARFAKAAHQALLKMTKGMTVARFLASHQSPKARDTFGRLLDAELAKGKSAAPVVNDAPNNSPALASTSRLPLQPSGG